jgi:hypothetical protein
MARGKTLLWLLSTIIFAAAGLGCSRQLGAQGMPAGEEPPPSVHLLDEDWGGGAAREQPEAMVAPAGDQSITGKIILPAARRAGVTAGDTIFISARRRGAFPDVGSLLAAQRLQADEFPLSFTLSAQDAMTSGTAFEGTVNITVRVDKDGDPLTRQRGDISGRANDVPVGAADVVVSLDSVQKENVTLAGASLVDRSSLPSGHP